MLLIDFLFFFLPLQGAMAIFDRYPLIDGTFFLSPKQYTNKCIPVSETRSNVFEPTRRNSNRVKDRAKKKKNAQQTRPAKNLCRYAG